MTRSIKGKPRPSAALHPSSAVATDIRRRIQAEPQAGLIAHVVGPGGTGKTAWLSHLKELYLEAGVSVNSDLGDNTFDAAGTAIVVDDAHTCTSDEVQRLHQLAAMPESRVILSYRAIDCAQRLLTVGAGQSHRWTVQLTLWDEDAVSIRLEQLLGHRPAPALVAQMYNRTGGLPVLVDRIVEASSSADLLGGTLPDATPAEIVRELSAMLDSLDASVLELLVTASLAPGIDPDAVAAVLDLSRAQADHIYDEARATGFLLPGDRVVPTIADIATAAVRPQRLREIRDGLIDASLDPLIGSVTLARQLSRTGVQNPNLARLLEAAADLALTQDPAESADLYAAAVRAGLDPVATAARQAEAAMHMGDSAAALSFADRAMAGTKPADLGQAVSVTAGLLNRRGLNKSAAHLYRWLGTDRVGSHGPEGALTLFGAGAFDEAQAMLSARSDVPPGLRHGAERLMAEGVRESLTGTTASALSALTTALAMMEPVGSSIALPDTPAALTALVALHAGEFRTAQTVLRRAIDSDFGGLPAWARHRLLLGWTAMIRGQDAIARDLLEEVRSSERPLDGRDEYFACALGLGLDRRAGDTAAVAAAWPNACEAILRHQVDLYSLLPLGEYAIVAARLREPHRLAPQLAAAAEITDRLGNPFSWSALLHWSETQAAVLDTRVADLDRHVGALVSAAHASPFCAVLSAAAVAWTQILAGTIEFAPIAEAARGLEAAGLPWDGSRLAGQGAARTTDRKVMMELMQCARELADASSAKAAERAPVPAQRSAPPSLPFGAAALSPREEQVARLVLEGRTYRQISEALFLSVKTVEHHIARIRKRLGATNRSELYASLRTVLQETSPHP